MHNVGYCTVYKNMFYLWVQFVKQITENIKKTTFTVKWILFKLWANKTQ